MGNKEKARVHFLSFDDNSSTVTFEVENKTYTGKFTGAQARILKCLLTASSDDHISNEIIARNADCAPSSLRIEISNIKSKITDICKDDVKKEIEVTDNKRGFGYKLLSRAGRDNRKVSPWAKEWEDALTGYNNGPSKADATEIVEMRCSWLGQDKEKDLWPKVKDTLQRKYDNTVAEASISAFKIHVNDLLEKNGCVDWLKSQSAGEHQINLANGHQLWSQYCNQHSDTDYAFRYAFAHSIEAGDFSAAKDFLDDLHFQRQRINWLTPEKAIPCYVDELACLYQKNTMLARQVMGGDAFLRVLGEHGILFFRKGLFFRLKECGFNAESVVMDVLEKAKDSGFSPDDDTAKRAAAVGLCLYATDTYRDAMGAIDLALKNADALKAEVKAELQNLSATCALKDVNLEQAAIKYQIADQGRSKKQKADAAMGQGKILSYRSAGQDDPVAAWNAADQKFCEAEVLLDGFIDAEDLLNPVEAAALRERKAEWLRFAAILGLWVIGAEADKSKFWLSKATAVYEELEKNDSRVLRYGYRFLATKMAFHIASTRLTDAEFKVLKDQKEEADSNGSYIVEGFERAQMSFWLGVAAAKCGKHEEAKDYLLEALKQAKTIHSWVEATEAAAVYDALFNTDLLNDGVFNELSSPAAIDDLQKWAACVVGRLGFANGETE